MGLGGTGEGVGTGEGEGSGVAVAWGLAVSVGSGVLVGTAAGFGAAVGCAPSPDDCSLALRGMKTMAVRLKTVEESALALARWLAEPDPQVPVHAEMIAGHDQQALLHAQASHQLGRVDRVIVADVHDRAGVWRHVAEEAAVRIEPAGHDWKILVQDGSRSRQDTRPP